MQYKWFLGISWLVRVNLKYLVLYGCGISSLRHRLIDDVNVVSLRSLEYFYVDHDLSFKNLLVIAPNVKNFIMRDISSIFNAFNKLSTHELDKFTRLKRIAISGNFCTDRHLESIADMSHAGLKQISFKRNCRNITIDGVKYTFEETVPVRGA